MRRFECSALKDDQLLKITHVWFKKFKKIDERCNISKMHIV